MIRRLPLACQADLENAQRDVKSCRAQGGVILLPTETFYGLAADPKCERAIRRIYELKERPMGMPLPVLVSGWPQLEALCHVPAEHRSWLEQQWPGKLTAVLPLRVPLCAAGENTLAVRIPDHDLLRNLLEEVGPLTGTSANRSGQAATCTVEEALEGLTGSPDLILDGGRTPGGKATKIIRFFGSQRQQVR